MNERIKELMVQSIDYACVNQKSMDTAMEKFAELIVKECVSIIEHGMDHTEYNDSEKSMVELEAQRWCRTAIKEHFGVDNK